MEPVAPDALRIPEEIAATLVTPGAYGDSRTVEVAHRWLRNNNPLGIATIDGFDSFWAVTKHADILQISRNNDLFHSGDRALMIMDRESVAGALQATGTPNVVQSIATMDNPDHHKYRMLTQQWFMPKHLAARISTIRALARRAVDRLFETGPELDFNTIAVPYALHVVMGILGVPEADEARILRLAQHMVGIDDPELGRDAGGGNFAASFFDVRSDFEDYFTVLMKSRRDNPAEDLASVIANSVIDGEPIRHREAIDYFVAIATAGHDTTSTSTAGAIWALAANPEQLSRVRKDTSLISGLVDEAIRWMTPIQSFMRCATADTQIRNRSIKKGDWLMLCYISGNRDESVFTDPDVFRLERHPNPHLGFGYGGHHCLGMHLAKLEMRIFFEELIPRLASLTLSGTPKRTDGLVVGGMKYLPIRVVAE